MEPLNVLIVEDDHLLRNGLELIIQAETDMNVIGKARDGLEAINIIKHMTPDLVLLDLQMPGMNGIECIKEIRKLHPDLPILILTTFNEEEYIFQGLAYGANGYLLKDMDFKKLVQTIRDAAKRQFVLPAEVAANIAKYVLTNSSFMKDKYLDQFLLRHQFTEQEKELIKMLHKRWSNKEIAAKMFITEGTVKNKLTVIYEKLGVQNRQEAIQKLEASIKNSES